MEDWEDIKVQTNSPDDLIKLQILWRRDSCLNILRQDRQKERKGVGVRIERSKGYIEALYYEVKQGYIATKRPDIQAEIDGARSFQELFSIFDLIDEYLYQKGFTRPRAYSDPKDQKNVRW